MSMAIGTGRAVPTGVQVGPTLSTEFTVTGFQLAVGVFGGLAAIVAAQRLERLDRDVTVGELVVPVLIAGGSTLLGAWLLPTKETGMTRL